MNMNTHEQTPVVSVIMPAYNASRFLAEAIGSVANQSEENWELLVIDDCSADDSFDIAQRYAARDSRIQVLRNHVNLGVAKTRNRGVELAKGKYVAFLDSDDVWHPEKLERQLKKMRDTGAGICYCSYRIIGAAGDKIRADYHVPETARLEDILKENYIQCSAMLIRADIVKRFFFNTEFFHEDYILGLDMLSAGEKAVGCRELLLDWRYLENSRSFDKKKSAVNRWRIYRDYLHLPLYKSLYLFANYTLAGVHKYMKKN